jgi:pyrroline-5-carboxylate reductase
VSKRNLNPVLSLKDKQVKLFSDNKLVIQDAKIILIAVKPYDLAGILNEIDPYINSAEHILVSVATGVTISQIKANLTSDVPVFRAMPNTASDINQAVTCISTNETNPEKIALVQDFFNQLGASIMIKEELMEAATVLGACGIAYVLRFMRSMVQGGIQIGFDSQTATEIVNQVVKGAAELLIERKEHPEQEIDKVTTPKGCTIVGLNEMEHNGFSSSLIKGISASYKQIEK